MTNDCEAMQRRIVALSDRELGEDERGLLDGHLAACGSCREWRRGHESFKQLWASAPRLLSSAEDRLAVRSYGLRYRWPAFYPPPGSLAAKLLGRGWTWPPHPLDRLTLGAVIGCIAIGVQLARESDRRPSGNSYPVVCYSEQAGDPAASTSSTAVALHVEQPS